MATQPDATPLDAVAAHAASDAGGLDVAFLGNFLDVVTDAVLGGIGVHRALLVSGLCRPTSLASRRIDCARGASCRRRAGLPL